MNRKMLKNMAIYALPLVFTAVANADTLANLATNVTAQFTAIGQLMIGVAYVAGIGFGISAIFKFKQHKDNPTQIPIGTPFALLAV
ncbi:MAG: type IV secretion protein IcmD, partial [Legionellales bacterium]|nr:type IV secretion protein IcmD [Legionellales bacterium]